MRYLGLSLGTGVALGYCAIFGTLLPPIIKEYFPQVPSAESFSQIALSTPGRITLAGVALCLVGILLAAAAGLAKEKHLPPAEKEKTIAEFSFSKGMLVATFCGIMSACFAFGLTAGNPINDASLAAGTTRLWTGLPKLVVVLLGGLTTNVVCCVVLNIRNRSAQQYYAANQQTPLLRNYLFSALAGATCYLQFLFYTMGETQMGKFSFASWTLHMASIIIFATIWGWVYHEWKGSGGKAHALIGVGLAILVLSTIVIGWGTFLKVQGGPN
jgi:L-rhamnose-H+ transport protein